MNQQCRLAPDAKSQRILEIAASAIETASENGYDIVELDVSPTHHKLPPWSKHGQPVPVAENERKCKISVSLGGFRMLLGKSGNVSSIDKLGNATARIEAMLDRSGLAWKEIGNDRIEVILEDRQR